jgi:hypothetical protein
MTGYFTFLQDDFGTDQVQWTPKSAKDAKLAAAVAAFRPVDTPAGKLAGQQNAKFLQEEALDKHPSTVTHLLLRDGRVEGFFALCSGTAKMSEGDDRGPGHGDREVRLSPRQPVAHIAWIGRDRDSVIAGTDLLAAAVALALEIIDLGQGQLALSLDAFDEATARMWIENFGFNRTRDFDGRIPLWRGLEEIPGDED